MLFLQVISTERPDRVASFLMDERLHWFVRTPLHLQCP